MIKNLDLGFIKEVFYVTGTFPKIDLLLNSYFESFHWQKSNYVWVIYSEEDGVVQIILAKTFNNKISLPKVCFRDALLLLPDTSRGDIVYLTSIYFETIDSDVANKAFTPYIGPITDFKAFTKYSFGYIAFRHQLGYLYGLVQNCTGTEAMAWVKEISSIPDTDLRFNDHLSFNDIVEELTLNKKTYRANWKDAQNLHDLLLVKYTLSFL